MALKGQVKDAARQHIHWLDLVTFNETPPGAHGDRGLALVAYPDDTLRVRCADGARVVVKARDVTVVDRSFICRRSRLSAAAAPPSGGGGQQFGVITGATAMLDLVRLSSGEAVARDVSPADVQRDGELSLADYVVSGPWLGRVVEVSLDVDVRFGDGAVCRVTRAGSKLRTLDNDFWAGVFYLGQRVVGTCPSVFKSSRWLVKGPRRRYSSCEREPGPGRKEEEEGTVARVVVSGVLVYWIASSELGTERTPLFLESAPPAYQRNARNLTFLCGSGDPTVLPNVWFVGHRCAFRSGDKSTSRAATEDGRRSTSVRRPLRIRTHRQRRRREAEQRRRQPAESLCVANTRTAVDVLWQDGTRQYGVPSASLVSLDVWNEHEFVPGQRVVLRNALTEASNDGPPPRLGIVQSFNYKDQTVCVSWASSSSEEEEAEELTTLSAYNPGLSSDSDHNFSYGYFVVRLRPTDSSPARGNGEQEQVPAQKKTKNKEDISWVGKIIDLCDRRYIKVMWADGNKSKVLLHEIAVVKPQSIGEMLQEMGDWVDDDDAVDSKDAPGASDNQDGSPAAAARTVGWAGTVTKTVIRLAGNLIVQAKRYMFNGLAAAAMAIMESDGDGRAVEATSAAAALESDIGSGAQQVKTEADAIGGDALFRFPHFDVQQSPPDHHYLNNIAEQGTSGESKWIKRVQKEWKFLQDNLPDTIYVRAFEDRMDLFRAAMVGASGTPYQDGLFFFDLQLPPSYPAVPPLVSYRSFGLRLNPNLYESGTVCLSLLGTFGGEGAELWLPRTSSVFQVVVSIQGLVLTTQPFYNEAGYSALVGTPQGRRNELPYSENAYLLTLRTMLHLLRRPPAGFEAFIREHFRRRGRHVLGACEAYLEGGCTVGTLDGEARPTEVSRERPCSAGFKIALGNVVPQLVEAFKEIGADGCE